MMQKSWINICSSRNFSEEQYAFSINLQLFCFILQIKFESIVLIQIQKRKNMEAEM